MLTPGVNNLNSWGLLLPDPAAPFTVLGLSPAPVMIALGIVLVQLFFVRTRRRAAAGGVPLVSLSVFGSARERAAIYAMFVVVALEAALNFTVFVTALLVVRVYDRFTRGRSSRSPSGSRPQPWSGCRWS